MSSLFISLKHSPLISIKMTEDLFDHNKDWIVEVFGIKAIQGMSRGTDGIIYFDIEANDDELEIMTALITKVYNSHIVKEIEIDLNMN